MTVSIPSQGPPPPPVGAACSPLRSAGDRLDAAAVEPRAVSDPRAARRRARRPAPPRAAAGAASSSEAARSSTTRRSIRSPWRSSAASTALPRNPDAPVTRTRPAREPVPHPLVPFPGHRRDSRRRAPAARLAAAGANLRRAGGEMGGSGASIQFSAMARRTRRRRRASHTSKWKKILVPLGVLVAALAVAGGAAATWAIDVYNSAPPLSSLQPVQKGRSSAIYAADGSLIGFIRSSNVRQPVTGDQLPAGPQGRDGRDRGPRLLRARRRSTPTAIVRAAFKNIEAGARRSRAPRRSPSSWSATSTSSTPNRRSSES